MIDGLPCRMLVDTGSEVSAVSWNWFRKQKIVPKIKPSGDIITSASGDSVKILGMWTAEIAVMGTLRNVNMYVMKGLNQPGIL